MHYRDLLRNVSIVHQDCIIKGRHTFNIFIYTKITGIPELGTSQTKLFFFNTNTQNTHSVAKPTYKVYKRHEMRDEGTTRTYVCLIII